MIGLNNIDGFYLNNLEVTEVLESELDYQRAFILLKKIRLLKSEYIELEQKYCKIKKLIKDYEDNNWSHKEIHDEKKLTESDRAEEIAEQEYVYCKKRKDLLLSKIQELDLSINDFSELLNISVLDLNLKLDGVLRFEIEEIIIINKFLKVGYDHLLPYFNLDLPQIIVEDKIHKLKNDVLIQKLHLT